MGDAETRRPGRGWRVNISREEHKSMIDRLVYQEKVIASLKAEVRKLQRRERERANAERRF